MRLMSDPKKQPTMEDVARAAGVHRTTVSMALRNHRRIPEATRERIRAIAEQMGYRKHPLISALMTYRACHRQPDWQGTLGVLTFGSSRDFWQRPKAYARIAQGMERRASELGYGLDPIWVSEPGMTPKRLMGILRARSINGIILTPNVNQDPTPPPLDLDWSSLSAVAIGYSLPQPDPHRVASDYFHNLALAHRQCVALGYRRIGLVLQERADRSVGHLWSASFLNEQRLHPHLTPIPPLVFAETADTKECIDELMTWLDDTRVDVFMSLPSTLRIYEEHCGQRTLPGGVGWVNLGCYEPEGHDSGIYPNYWNLGATAVDFVIAMIQRGECGLPLQSHTLMIKGTWRAGGLNSADGPARRERCPPCRPQRGGRR